MTLYWAANACQNVAPFKGKTYFNYLGKEAPKAVTVACMHVLPEISWNL